MKDIFRHIILRILAIISVLTIIGFLGIIIEIDRYGVFILIAFIAFAIICGIGFLIDIFYQFYKNQYEKGLASAVLLFILIVLYLLGFYRMTISFV